MSLTIPAICPETVSTLVDSRYLELASHSGTGNPRLVEHSDGTMEVVPKNFYFSLGELLGKVASFAYHHFRRCVLALPPSLPGADAKPISVTNDTANGNELHCRWTDCVLACGPKPFDPTHADCWVFYLHEYITNNEGINGMCQCVNSPDPWSPYSPHGLTDNCLQWFGIGLPTGTLCPFLKGSYPHGCHQNYYQKDPCPGGKLWPPV